MKRMKLSLQLPASEAKKSIAAQAATLFHGYSIRKGKLKRRFTYLSYGNYESPKHPPPKIKYLFVVCRETPQAQ